MRMRDGGVWELFIPHIGAGTHYKYSVRSKFYGYHQLKADPSRFACEEPPKSASIVADLDSYQWQDQQWLDERARTDWLRRPVLGLRGSPRLVPARPAQRGAHVSRACRQAGRLREGPRLHAHRAAADHGASVFGLVGLPGDRLLHADRALRHARGLHVFRRPLPPGRHRRHSRLGARALSQGRARPAPSSTAPRSTSTPTRARASTRTGAR